MNTDYSDKSSTTRQPLPSLTGGVGGESIDFAKMGGLVPAIIQDADTKTVLMLGYMNEEALQKTLDTKKVTFWSRSRKCLWTKGETSGNFLHLVDIKVDCDNDTLLVKAHPDGPTCHTGTDTCWGEVNSIDELRMMNDEYKSQSSINNHQSSIDNQQSSIINQQSSIDNPLLFLSDLQDFIEKRHEEMPEGSYTTSLFKDGLNRMAQKVGEEALELVIEACNGTNERMIYEGSDMLYHLIVLLTSKGMRIEDMARELQERHQPGWKKH